MYKIHLGGQLPAHCLQAVGELCSELPIELAQTGIFIEGKQGERLEVHKQNNHVRIVWNTPVQFYRALGLIPFEREQFDCTEAPCFETLGMMFDVSRNAVLQPKTLRFFLRKMALMGFTLGMMYTEDTYEVPEYPYFGYLRGKYSQQQLRELDDYADLFGIELCPCIQTLGHLNRVLHWPEMAHLADNSEVLLADSDETYTFLKNCIAAASAPYRSKRIHIGMDEAHGIGLGAHLRRFGYEAPHAIIARHLKRVRQITDELGLHAMMWSDMFFRPDSPTNGYYDTPSMPSTAAMQALVPNTTLVYWDYYHNSSPEYEEMLQKHAALDAEIAFAGGIWTWAGPATDYDKTFKTTVPALSACRKHGVKTVLATAWGDNGAEANLLTALLGMQLYSEYTYTQTDNSAQLASRFEHLCRTPMQAFSDLSLFNTVEGMESGWLRPVNAAKFLLYQDPMVQLYAKDTEGLKMAQHYAMLHQKYTQYAARKDEFSALYTFYASLANALALKCSWHENAAKAALAQDRTLAMQLADIAHQTAEAVEQLRLQWFALWQSTNKPHGFEILDARLGGVYARMQTAALRMENFARGQENETLDELCETPLQYTKKADGTLFGSYAVGEIVSACKIDL